MITCVADDCKHNQNCKCVLEDITLNLDLKCTKFRLKKRNCKRCGLEFQPKNNRSEYCSIKCRNHFNVDLYRGKPVEDKSTHKNNIAKPNIESTVEKGFRKIEGNDYFKPCPKGGK
jgi:hypothetical protein